MWLRIAETLQANRVVGPFLVVYPHYLRITFEACLTRWAYSTLLRHEVRNVTAFAHQSSGVTFEEHLHRELTLLALYAIVIMCWRIRRLFELGLIDPIEAFKELRLGGFHLAVHLFEPLQILC
jgi:hypothetical protein